MTDSERLDLDLAILIVTSPVWVSGFVGLFVAGALMDWWRCRG